MIKIRLEKLNVNDDKYKLNKWLVKDGDQVKENQPIAEFETSKAAVEVESTQSGILRYLIEEGTEIVFNTPICCILNKEENFIYPKKNNFRIERKHNKDSKGFKTKRPYNNNRAEKISKENDSNNNNQKIDVRKKSEINNLKIGNSHNLTSTLFTYFRFSSRKENFSNNFFKNNFTDIFIYEASKLITEFPKLNSFFYNDKIFFYEKLMFGYSVDINEDLIVYNLGSDSYDNVKLIQEKILESLEFHLLKKIPSQSIKDSTITITDISGTNLNMFVPLINGRQSCIFGLTKSSSNKINIVVTFDHRIMSGKYVSDFLSKLINNIQKHFNFIDNILENECYYCAKSLDFAKSNNEKGFLQIINNKGIKVSCCRICFEGW